MSNEVKDALEVVRTYQTRASLIRAATVLADRVDALEEEVEDRVDDINCDMEEIGLMMDRIALAELVLESQSVAEFRERRNEYRKQYPKQNTKRDKVQ